MKPHFSYDDAIRPGGTGTSNIVKREDALLDEKQCYVLPRHLCGDRFGIEH